MKKTKFPRLPEEADGRYKISRDTKNLIKQMAGLGLQTESIAKSFGISKTSVFRELNPEYAEKSRETVRQYRRNHPEKKGNYDRYAADRKREKLFPEEFSEYKKSLRKDWYSKNKDKAREYCREYYEKKLQENPDYYKEQYRKERENPIKVQKTREASKKYYKTHRKEMIKLNTQLRAKRNLAKVESFDSICG